MQFKFICDGPSFSSIWVALAEILVVIKSISIWDIYSSEISSGTSKSSDLRANLDKLPTLLISLLLQYLYQTEKTSDGVHSIRD